MKISIDFIGDSILELVIENSNTKMTEYISDSNGIVSDELIDNLEEILETLKSNNDDKITKNKRQ